MSIIEDLGTSEDRIPDVKQKNIFEAALSKLDLQSTLTLMTVLSERALFLHSKATLESNKLVKPKKQIIT